MTIDELDPNKYRKPDGEIDWGKYSIDKLSIMDDNDNLSFINNRKSKPVEVQELSVFKLADELCDLVWDIVSKWDWFAKKTIGDQWVRATDSIAANITEGYGRYFFGDYVVFLYYARGSLYEAKFWLEKAHKRKLLINYHLSLKNGKLSITGKSSVINDGNDKSSMINDSNDKSSMINDGNDKSSMINDSNDQLYNHLKQKFDRLPIELNKVIKIVKSELKKWKGRPKY